MFNSDKQDKLSIMSSEEIRATDHAIRGVATFKLWKCWQEIVAYLRWYR